MSKNLLYELNDVIRELDYNRVSWIDKHFIIDLQQKAQVLLESLSRLENGEKEAATAAAQAFLIEVAPVISELNKSNQEI